MPRGLQRDGRPARSYVGAWGAVEASRLVGNTIWLGEVSKEHLLLGLVSVPQSFESLPKAPGCAQALLSPRDQQSAGVGQMDTHTDGCSLVGSK